MDQTTELSPGTCGGSILLPHHVEQLRNSGLSDATIAAAKLYSVTDPMEAGRLLNWKGPGPAPALAFPQFDLAGNVVQTVLRPDNPRTRDDGSVAKYEQPLNDHHRVYFAPMVDRALILDPAQPLILTEGIKKALCAIQAGGCCISMQGVSVWHDARHRAEHKDRLDEWLPHLDLTKVPLAGRPVYVAFDGGDTSENPPVILAEARLARLLIDAGARVRLFRPPFAPRGPKVGLDDYLTSQPDPIAALRNLCETAIDADPLERVTVAAGAPDAERAALAILKDHSFVAALRVADAGVADLVHKRLKPLGFSRDAVNQARERLNRALTPPAPQPTCPAPVLGLADPQPASEEQDTASLLDEVKAAFVRHVFIPDEGATALALWVLHTWAFKAARFTPRLLITSPTRRCGKSTVLDLLSDLSKRGLSASNISAAALFRTIELAGPTFIIDEADSFLPDKEELRGVINAGYERGGHVLRCVGDEFEPKSFDCFAPVAIAAIGGLPSTIVDRSISIRMERKNKGVRLARRTKDAKAALGELRPKLARWSADHVNDLADASPDLPDALNDRQRDICEPLLAIAELAGGRWPALARSAFVKLGAIAEVEAADRRERALFFVWTKFADSSDDAIPLGAIVRDMIADETGGWDTALNGRPINTSTLAKWMAEFGLKSRQLRATARVRSFVRSEVAAIAAKYLALETAPTPIEHLGLPTEPDPTPQLPSGSPTDTKSGEAPPETCHGVTVASGVSPRPFSITDLLMQRRGRLGSES